MKKQGLLVWAFTKKLWSRHTLVAIIVAIFSFWLLSLFTNIPSGAAAVELQTARETQSIATIVKNPVNAPYKFAVYVTTFISPSVRAVRAVSFVFYILACVAMFYALKHWHTLQTAILTTAAFASNAVVLGISRLGTPLISLMSLFIFSGMLLWQLHSKSNKFVPYIVLVALAGIAYTPGAIWFLTMLIIVFWKRFRNLFKNVKQQALYLGLLTGAVVILPLILSFIRDSSNLNEWLLLPDTLKWAEVPRSILRVPSAFIYRMPQEPLINVARLPIFDVASGLMFLIGLNAYRKKFKLDRTRVMIGSALIGTVVGALGQLLYAIVFILPFAYSVIAAGLEFMLDEWHTVFPKNPFARSFGVIFLSSVILFSMYYQLTRFFVVWPQTEDTRSTYSSSVIIQE